MKKFNFKLILLFIIIFQSSFFELAQALDPADLTGLYNNAICSSRLRKITPEIREQIVQIDSVIKGLNYIEVIPFKRSISLRISQWTHMIGDKAKHFPLNQLKTRGGLPIYDSSKKIGFEEISIKDIRFMQNHADNLTKDKKYTVINNAISLKNKKLSPSDLPSIKVWRDIDGNVWTLDHRRLASFKLSGVVDRAMVEFVTEEEMLRSAFKYHTFNDGRSMVISVEETDAAILIN